MVRKSELSLFLRDGAELVGAVHLLLHPDLLLLHPQTGQLLEGLAAGMGEAQQLLCHLCLLLLCVAEAGVSVNMRG